MSLRGTLLGGSGGDAGWGVAGRMVEDWGAFPAVRCSVPVASSLLESQRELAEVGRQGAREAGAAARVELHERAHSSRRGHTRS